MAKPKLSKKILLVEDDPDQIYLYSTKLELEGFQVVIAKNGREGIEKAKSEKPNLILLDLIMEEIDGIEALEILKNTNEAKTIPTILLTNLIKKDLMDKAEKLGAIGFWSKSEVLPREIVSRIKTILRIK